MADSEEIPFLKQLVDSDRKIREKALESLRLYLTSGREFTELELMKLWRGLFYCMYHTAPPYGPPRLSALLTSLLLSLPPSLNLAFQRAFWRTQASLYPTLDQHRLDKFLLLMRRYIGAGMEDLVASYKSLNVSKTQDARASAEIDANVDVESKLTNEGKVEEWLGLMAEEGAGPLCLGVKEVDGVIVGDGVRYHALDVWVDELEKTVEDEKFVKRLLEPVERLAKEGRTKTVRKRAKEVLDDERLRDWGKEKEGKDAISDDCVREDEEEEWGGLD